MPCVSIELDGYLFRFFLVAPFLSVVVFSAVCCSCGGSFGSASTSISSCPTVAVAMGTFALESFSAGGCSIIAMVIAPRDFFFGRDMCVCSRNPLFRADARVLI